MLRPQLYVYCHRPSSGANALSSALLRQGVRTRRIYGRKPIRFQLPVINWGCRSLVNIDRSLSVVNPAQAVNKAQSKVITCQILEQANIPCVKLSSEVRDANSWIEKGSQVLVRRDFMSAGRGTRPYNVGGNQAVPGIDFYSRIFPKTHEFRVHVVGGHAIDIVQKKARAGGPLDRVIRVHSNGWIYAHDGLSVDAAGQTTIEGLAISAVGALGLDFGAVDILAILRPRGVQNDRRELKRAVVCEINTAPGLENKLTIERYASQLAQEIRL